MFCDYVPQNVIAIDPDMDEHYVLTPKPKLRAAPTLSETKQFEPAINPNNVTAQKAGILTKENWQNSWNVFYSRKILIQHSWFRQKPSHMTLWLLPQTIQNSFHQVLTELNLVLTLFWRTVYTITFKQCSTVLSSLVYWCIHCIIWLPMLYLCFYFPCYTLI